MTTDIAEKAALALRNPEVEQILEVDPKNWTTGIATK